MPVTREVVSSVKEELITDVVTLLTVLLSLVQLILPTNQALSPLITISSERKTGEKERNITNSIVAYVVHLVSTFFFVVESSVSIKVIEDLSLISITEGKVVSHIHHSVN